jgi:hypothetical protein
MKAIKDLEKIKKQYEEYINSPEAKLERFLDKLEEERQHFEKPISGKKHFRLLSRRQYNG